MAARARTRPEPTFPGAPASVVPAPTKDVRGPSADVVMLDEAHELTPEVLQEFIDLGTTKEPVYVCGVRPLEHQGRTLVEGDVVEGAHTWPRVEAWVRAKRIVRAS